jgi:uncharacterized protein
MEHRLRNFIRSLPPWGEFAVVMAIAFGLPIANGLMAAVRLLLEPHYQYHYTAGRLEFLLVAEIVLAAILVPFLRLRGWTAGRLGLTTRALDIGWAIALFVAVQVVLIVVWWFAYAVAPQTIEAMVRAPSAVFARDLPLWAIIAASLINPVIEETLECGYVMTVLDYRRNPWLAINASVALRLCLHLYQGGFGVMTIVPFGLIYALWFARTGRLWPLILAHGAQDFLALYQATQT